MANIKDIKIFSNVYFGKYLNFKKNNPIPHKVPNKFIMRSNSEKYLPGMKICPASVMILNASESPRTRKNSLLVIFRSLLSSTMVPVSKNENTKKIIKCAENSIRSNWKNSGFGNALPGVQVKIKEKIIQDQRSLGKYFKDYSAIKS